MGPAIDLHDATLLAIRVVWAAGTCSVDIRHGEQGDCVLTFSGLAHLTLPRVQAWGPSASIHDLTEEGGEFAIEMQSGDLIKIKATDAVLAVREQA